MKCEICGDDFHRDSREREACRIVNSNSPITTFIESMARGDYSPTRGWVGVCGPNDTQYLAQSAIEAEGSDGTS